MCCILKLLKRSWTPGTEGPCYFGTGYAWSQLEPWWLLNRSRGTITEFTSYISQNCQALIYWNARGTWYAGELHFLLSWGKPCSFKSYCWSSTEEPICPFFCCTLGFKPSVVIVVGNGLPMMYFNSSASKYHAMAAVGLPGGASLGIELTTTGFKVKSGESTVAKGCYPLLNEAGTTYFYIAFR